MMKNRNKEYYAVLEGRHLAMPTIYSSWAKAHLRTSGYTALPKGFETLQEAKFYMTEHGVSVYKTEIASKNEDTTPAPNREAFYAVAFGAKPGIYRYYNSKNGAKPQVDKVKHNCNKHFRTLKQARQFMVDWIILRADLMARDVQSAQVNKQAQNALKPDIIWEAHTVDPLAWPSGVAADLTDASMESLIEKADDLRF